MIDKKSFLSLTRMKQVTAIFLICVFAFSQYAKQFAYMECKLANNFKPVVQQCDCEKKYNVHILNEKTPVGAPIHFHPIIDEFYAAATNKIMLSYFIFRPGLSNMPPSADICKGTYATPYRPPQA